MDSSPRPDLRAGTQVVVLAEVRGPNHSLVHPAGTVGVITRTPTRGGLPYLIRLPDGFEMSVEGSQLEVLKNPPAGLGDRSAPGTLAASGFRLESLVIYQAVVGSRAYGLEHEDSDADVRGVYLAPADLHWSLFGVPGQFEDDSLQSCHWELQKFLVLALRANPNVLECLFSPRVDRRTSLGDGLLALRGRLLSRMIFQTFNGYARSQFRKIEPDLRSPGNGRWKHAMHLLRLLITGAATLRAGTMPVHVGADRQRLLAVKRGEVPWAEVEAWRRSLHEDFERALAETRLPERPDYEAANRFLVHARGLMAQRFEQGLPGVPR